MENLSVYLVDQNGFSSDLVSVFLKNRLNFSMLSRINASEEECNFTEPSAMVIDYNCSNDIKEEIKRLRDKNNLLPIMVYNSDQANTNDLIAAGADDTFRTKDDGEIIYLKIKNAINKYLLALNQNSGISILDEAKLVSNNSKNVSLTSREYAIFKSLYQEINEPVSRERILTSLEKEEKLTRRNIDVHIFSLRKKLIKIGLKVETIRGIGYKLYDEPK
jgi:DNA-binding response OmpR family regulator